MLIRDEPLDIEAHGNSIFRQNKTNWNKLNSTKDLSPISKFMDKSNAINK